ncbi:hypothetical protein GpartN1_g5356.t1 [Galdieria partita]|uniref:Aquaporin-like protein n=1 Tax=Galdieria partita TaxID=83374 RepID=A0A9C7Q014_9RHOD|nr:hypothetical protein GpartN1_g5356.t1 [Galdieria partita]
MSNVAHHGVIEMEDGKHRISRERSIFLLVPPSQHQVIRREIRQLIPELIGEFLGMWYVMATATAITCMLLFYNPSPFLPGFLGLALPWGFAFTFMVFAVGAISGGHFNFSVTLAFACFRGFPKWKALPYFFAQVLGGICGTLNMWFTYYPVGYQIAAGKPLSEATTVAAAFFNNADLSEYTTIHSFGIQAFYTAFLLFVIFAITDPYNPLAPGANMFPVIVGFLVMQLGCSLGMINQFTINPSRDLSARIAGAMLGMGKTALPGPGGMLWANQIGSMLGGISGGFVYEALVRPFMPRVEELGPTPFMIQWEKFYNWIRGRKGESLYGTRENGIGNASQDDQIQGAETFEQKRYIHEEDKFASNVHHVPD